MSSLSVRVFLMPASKKFPEGVVMWREAWNLVVSQL